MSTTQKSLRIPFGRPGRPLKGSICRTCREGLARRKYASAAVAEAEAPSHSSSPPPVSVASSPKLAYQLRAGVVLSRAPQVTRDLTSFEKAFFLYQKRLNERLALPFTRYFYYRKGTPSEIDWKRKIAERKTAARDIGRYNPYLEDGWHDEVLVGAPESEPEHQMEALLKDVEVPVINKFQSEAERAAQDEDNAVQRPMPRVTQADKSGDQRSLNRLLSRTLYLLVQNQEGKWTFPSDRIMGRESFHLAAERVLVQSGGVNMNTWVVGNAPVGYYELNHPKLIEKDATSSEIGQKTFFMKARIMAGQANLEQNQFGLSDFKWLVKEEVAKTVSSHYWAQVRNMLPER